MDGRLGCHGVKEGDVVDTGADVREQVGYHLAAFPVRLEIPLGANDAAFVAFSSTPEGFYIDGLPVEGIEVWLVIEGVDMKRKMTDFALPGRGGFFGASGLTNFGSSLAIALLEKNPSWASIPVNPRAAKPPPRSRRNSLR